MKHSSLIRLDLKAVFKCSPQAFRKKREFYPLQLKYTADGCERLRGDRIMDIRTVECGKILLVGYKRNTRLGFLAVRECWRKMNAKKCSVPDRKNTEFLIGMNDYAEWNIGEEGQPAARGGLYLQGMVSAFDLHFK